MKKTFLFISLFLFCVKAHASWFIVDINNTVIAKIDYIPDANDLKSRNEIAVESHDNINFEDAEYRGGKIVKHVKTQAEKDAETAAAEEAKQLADVQKIMFENAAKQAYREGKSIDKLGNHVDVQKIKQEVDSEK